MGTHEIRSRKKFSAPKKKDKGGGEGERGCSRRLEIERSVGGGRDPDQVLTDILEHLPGGRGGGSRDEEAADTS